MTDSDKTDPVKSILDEIMKIGGRYNWKHQPERLIYLGHNWSGNGYWHQFALVDSPAKVWCEVTTSDLESFEETKEVYEK